MNLKKPFLSRRKIIVWIFALVLIYTLVGFFILPPIVRIIAVKELSRQLGRQVSIEKVKLNPYAFSATVQGFAIKDTDGGSQPFVSWDEVYVNFKFWSIFGKAWVVQEISLSQPHLQLARNRDGTFNYSDLLGRFPTNAAPAKPHAKSAPLALVFEKIRITDADIDLVNRQSYANTASARPAKVSENIVAPSIAPNVLILQAVTNVFAQLIGSTNQIAGMLEDVELTNGAVHFQDFGSLHPAKLDLTGINFEAKNISNVPGTNMTAQLSLRWNTNGSIAVDTTAALQPAALDLKFNLNQLDLGTLTPYLESVLDLYILSSQVGINGEVRLSSPKNQLPQVEFQGDMLLNGFHTVDGMMAQDLVAWSSIWYHGIDVSLNPESVSLQKLTITSPYERVIIETNRSINVYNVLHMASPLLPATNAPETVVAQQTTASTNAAPVASSGTVALPPISIGEIVITNESGRFTDRSISPNVNLDIENVNGTISGIAPLRPADINFRATIEGIGTATITGTVYPFSTTATNHIKISVKDVDLTPTSPYAGKFAGYGIAEGKLDMDVYCQVVGRKLDCTNVIVLDQFTFGDAVDSPDATHLPVRLAIAILKDRDGKIVLNVPIQGSLDDPKFGISKVVKRAVVNILEKVATSPFSLLGAMFGGSGEELSYENFPAGSAALTSAAIKKLDVMTNALYNRPGLQLEISGSIDPDGDLQGLQRAALDKQIRALIWKGLEKSAQATNSADQIVLSPGERQAWIDKLYRQAVADGRITPQLVTSDTNLSAYIATTWPQQPSKGATLLMASGKKNPANKYHTKLAPSPVPAEAILLALIPVEEGKFDSLAAYRAQIVEHYLIQAGVQPSRLFLKADTGQGLRRDGSRVYLQFR